MAKRTYTHTLFHDDLREATVTLYFSDGVKHSKVYGLNEDEEENKVEFKGLKSWTIVEGGEEAKAIESIIDETDENHEYLVLTFDNRNEFYRNSHVAMFII